MIPDPRAVEGLDVLADARDARARDLTVQETAARQYTGRLACLTCRSLLDACTCQQPRVQTVDELVRALYEQRDHCMGRVSGLRRALADEQHRADVAVAEAVTVRANAQAAAAEAVALLDAMRGVLASAVPAVGG